MTVVLASNNLVQMSYMPEADFAVIPVTGVPKNLRMTGESLDFQLTKENDKEINSSAQLTSSTTVNAAASGDIKIHMQYGEYDPLFASVMRTAWVAFGTNGVGATFTADITTTTITASVATSGSSIFTALAKGQWFRLVAPGNAANNGKLFRVSTVTAPTSTVITLDTNTPGVAASGVALCVVQSSRAANGVTLTSFTLQRESADTSSFFAYRGMYVSKFSTSFASSALTDGTFSFIGKDMLLDESATQFPAAATASLPYDIQNGVRGVGNIWEGGSPLTGTYIKSMSLDIDSALRAQEAIGNLGMVGAGIGTFMAKGTLEVYFADGSMFAKYLNDTYTSITVSTQDKDGNGYVFTFPKVQLTGAKIQAGGKDSDLMASFDYTAYQDLGNAVPALRKTLFIDRVGVAVVP
jgi:hypothetical protein